MKKKTLVFLLAALMCLLLLPTAAFAEGSSVSYLDANGTLQTANNVTEIDTPQDVGLSNILDSELNRRKPRKRPHRKIIRATIVNGKLLGKVI